MALKTHTQRALLRAFILSISACGLIGIYCLLLGNMGSLTGQVLATTACVGAASILGLAAAIPMEKRRWHPIGPVGLVAVAVALTFALLFIWVDGFFKIETMFQILTIACTLAVAFPHLGLLSLATLRREYEWIRRGTVVTILALAATIIGLIIFEFDGGDGVWRVIGVMAIVDVCGTIAIPILHRFSTIRHREEIQSAPLEVSMTCPRCFSPHLAIAGRSACKSCGLRFVLEIEEEHCEKCGFVIYQLTSKVCPECGTPIRRTEPAQAT